MLNSLPPSLSAALLFSLSCWCLATFKSQLASFVRVSCFVLWALDADYADYVLDVTPKPPLMGMALCFAVLALLIAVSASNCGAVQDIAGDNANPDWQHPFGTRWDSHTTNATDVTYDLLYGAVTVIFYGSNFVPVKRIGSGDVNATGMPIMTTSSVSLGLLVWASFNLLMGWASTRCVCIYQPLCPLRYCLANCLAVRL